MNPRFRRRLLVWHRRIGLTAIPFVAVLAITGILLNRTGSLELDRRTVASAWLLDWYGIGGAAPVSFAAGDSWVSGQGGRLYVDGAPVADNAAPLAGAAWRDPMLVAATADSIYLFAADGAPIEKAPAMGVPGPVEALAAGAGDTLFLRTPGGVFAGDTDLIEWRPAAPDGAPAWSRPAEPPPAVAAALAESWRGGGLPWERVLLDLHSGRLFGRFGPLAMDTAAVALLLLAASGLYNWLGTRR